jgi:putative polyhydroxyalkanoate system protein
MPDIEMVRRFSLPIAVAKARVQKTADELAAEYDLKSEWFGKTLRFDRSGLHGEIHVADSEIRLHVNLSILLKPLRARLISLIEDKFDRLFPEPGVKPHAKTPTKKLPPRAR